MCVCVCGVGVGGGLQCQVYSAVCVTLCTQVCGGYSAKSTVLAVSPCVLRCVGVTVPSPQCCLCHLVYSSVCVCGGGVQCQVDSAVCVTLCTQVCGGL